MLYNAIRGVIDTFSGRPTKMAQADALLTLNEALPENIRLTHEEMAAAADISTKTVHRQVKRRKGEALVYHYGDGPRGQYEQRKNEPASE